MRKKKERLRLVRQPTRSWRSSHPFYDGCVISSFGAIILVIPDLRTNQLGRPRDQRNERRKKPLTGRDVLCGAVLCCARGTGDGRDESSGMGRLEVKTGSAPCLLGPCHLGLWTPNQEGSRCHGELTDGWTQSRVGRQPGTTIFYCSRDCAPWVLYVRSASMSTYPSLPVEMSLCAAGLAPPRLRMPTCPASTPPKKRLDGLVSCAAA